MLKFFLVSLLVSVFYFSVSKQAGAEEAAKEVQEKKKSDLYIACEKHLNSQGVDIKGDFLVQASDSGKSIKTFAKNGFSLFEDGREVCGFYDRKTIPKNLKKESFRFPNAHNKTSLLMDLFSGVLIPGKNSKDLISGERCVFELLGLENRKRVFPRGDSSGSGEDRGSLSAE